MTSLPPGTPPSIQELKLQIEGVLSGTAGHVISLASEELAHQAHTTIREFPDVGKALGPMVARLERLLKCASETKLNWVSAGSGHIAVGHRPKLAAVASMHLHGVTHVLTLLSQEEGARSVGNAVEKAKLNWLWLPMTSGDPPEHDRTREFRGLFRAIESALESSQRVFIHCSAGIHRTGMVANALLHHLGCSEDEAREKLADLRQVTSMGVGEHRINWGRQFSKYSSSRRSLPAFCGTADSSMDPSHVAYADVQ